MTPVHNCRKLTGQLLAVSTIRLALHWSRQGKPETLELGESS